MNILKHYEKVLECMTIMSDDIAKLTEIVTEQQEQISILTDCVEQMQDILILDLRNNLK